MKYKILIKERDKMFTYICDEFKRDDKCIEFTDKCGKYRLIPLERLIEVQNYD